jgi:hypothetical protein
MGYSFAYNNGSSPSGTTKFAKLQIGGDNQEYTTYGGLNWYASAPYNGKFLIVSDTYSQGWTNQESATPTFWRSANNALDSLKDLVNQLPDVNGVTGFTDVGGAINYINSTDKYLISQENDVYPEGSIITSGLTFYLDGGYSNSYPKSGTTWYNMKGTNNGTLTNGPTFENSGIRFDGTDDYIPFNSIQVRTVQIWARADVGATSNLQGIICNSLNGDGSLRFLGGTFRNINSADLNDMQLGYPEDLWINGVKNPGNSIGSYYTVPDGRTLSQDFFVSVKADPTRYTSTVSSLSHNFISRRFKGIIYSVYLYDRWLSDDEILHNYNAQKGRFGL